jgi:hypothetical protein
LTNVEFIDPAKGKILGVADQEITYKTEYDPAVYNRGSKINNDFQLASAEVPKAEAITYADNSVVHSLNDFEKLYIATDEINHNVIKLILQNFPNSIIVNLNDINTIQFGSTCKNIILSQYLIREKNIGSGTSLMFHKKISKNLYFITNPI